MVADPERFSIALRRSLCAEEALEDGFIAFSATVTGEYSRKMYGLLASWVA
jgi:hypothetical protein